MKLFPAIDLKDGVCVRLVRGEMSRATIFNEDPVAQARTFEEAGFDWLHIVDLDGAIQGRRVNGGVVERIVNATGSSIQLGGGIRDMAAIEGWLERGVQRIVLGTAAVNNPELVREACARFAGRIAIGLDARQGRVAVEGWARTSDLSARDLALRFEDAGAAAIIHTDIERDGAMSGPNISATVALAEVLMTPVIASGGVTTLSDLAEYKRHETAGIMGVISGRAIYDGRIDMAAALKLMRGE